MTNNQFEDWNGGYDRAQSEQVGEIWHAAKRPAAPCSARHKRISKPLLLIELLLSLAFLIVVVVVITEH